MIRIYIAVKQFRGHRHTAGQRNIPFLLTFEEWWKIWQDSGHWTERGKGRDKYCMARIGDQGSYTVGNVKIITGLENAHELHTPEHRAYLRALFLMQNIPRRKNYKHSEATRLKLALACANQRRGIKGHFIK